MPKSPGDQAQADHWVAGPFVGLPPDSFPLLAANAAQMVAGDGDERFRFVIDVVIDGVVARAARR
jgi:hypothetical protein